MYFVQNRVPGVCVCVCVCVVCACIHARVHVHVCFLVCVCVCACVRVCVPMCHNPTQCSWQKFPARPIYERVSRERGPLKEVADPSL